MKAVQLILDLSLARKAFISTKEFFHSKCCRSGEAQNLLIISLLSLSTAFSISPTSDPSSGAAETYSCIDKSFQVAASLGLA